MPKTIDLNEIIKNNPKVDREQLAEGQKLFEALQRSGIRGHGNRLASPFERKRARIVDDLDSDPRLTRLLGPRR